MCRGKVSQEWQHSEELVTGVGRTLLKCSPDVHVRECQKLQGLEVMGDVEMLGCTLASGDGVGSGCPPPILPVLEQQAVVLPRLQQCMTVEKAGAAQPWLARNGRGSSRGVVQYELCPVSYYYELVTSLKPAHFKDSFCLFFFSLAHHPGRGRKCFSNKHEIVIT